MEHKISIIYLLCYLNQVKLGLQCSHIPFHVSLQNNLAMGVFSVSPCSGSLQPGSQQVITVNCDAKQLGNWNQCLFIDISDRDPLDQPGGIPYRLLAEVCKPGKSTARFF